LTVVNCGAETTPIAISIGTPTLDKELKLGDGDSSQAFAEMSEDSTACTADDIVYTHTFAADGS